MAILAGILLAAAAAPAPAGARPRPRVDAPAEAAAAVQRSAAYLRSLSSLTLDARMEIDTFDEAGKPARERNVIHYEYSAPDGLFLDWSSNGEKRQIYSNGSAISLFLPASSTYVTLAERSTAGEALGMVIEDFDIVMPLPDFFVWSGEKSPGPLPPVRRLGRQRIDGIVTDHYSVRQDDIDFQIWIDRGERPLPRRILIIAPEDPDMPRFAASLRWTVEPRH
ncbi:MAG TPA: DUF2092 domain-containing protein, partial [Allosphingosinicella sp.]